MTPLLISTFGVTPQVAVGTDLLYASITKTAGSWRHHVAENVEWPIVLRLAAGSIPASLILLAAIALIPLNTAALAHWIRMGLVVALPLSDLALVLYPILAGTPERGADGRGQPHVAITVLFGAALGLLVTLTSVGAGAIGVSVLAALYPHLPAKRIVGSDIAHAVPLTIVAGIGHASLGNVEWLLLVELLIGSLPGIWVGAKLTKQLPETITRFALCICLVIAARKILLTA